MEWYWLLLALLGSILILMFAGIPVGIAFLAVCTVTAYHLYGRFGGFDEHLSSAIFQLIENAFSNMANFAIVPIPMFLLMGNCSSTPDWRSACSTPSNSCRTRSSAPVLCNRRRRNRAGHTVRFVNGRNSLTWNTDGSGDTQRGYKSTCPSGQSGYRWTGDVDSSICPGCATRHHR